MNGRSTVLNRILILKFIVSPIRPNRGFRLPIAVVKGTATLAKKRKKNIILVDLIYYIVVI